MSIAKKLRRIALVLVLCAVVALCLYVVHFLQRDAMFQAGASSIRRVCEVSFALQDVDSRRFNVEWMLYECGLPLEECIAITIDSSILDSPLIQQRLIGHIRQPCETLAYARTVLSDAKILRLIKEAEFTFQCGKPEHYQIDVAVRYVTGNDRASRRIVSEQMVTATW
ncbi:MAG: hypothetical protein KUL88_00655 [Rhizobium sp.]|jgi:hypothetical protein|nr:hypothetical protein [Rhizobium sp.]